MKIIPILVFYIFAATSFAQQTAYKAMNVVGAARGQAFLDRLLVLEGLGGASQPATWRMIFEDVSSRGGYREIEVQNGKIVSQRAPLKNPFSASTPINLDRLQLDSDGAFTVAEQEAVRQKLSFDAANYLLQADERTGVPVWQMQLVGTSGRNVLKVKVAADTGRLLGGKNSEPEIQPREDPEGPRVDSTEPDVNDSDSTEAKIHRTMTRTGRNISNGFKHIGGSLQEIFTGRRTIDKDLPGE